MKNLLQIAAILAVFLIPGNVLADADVAKIQQVENHPAEYLFPPNSAVLFALHHQGESGVNSTNLLAKPNSFQDDESGLAGISEKEFSIRAQNLIYLRFADVLKQSSSIKVLIFPFHSFL